MAETVPPWLVVEQLRCQLGQRTILDGLSLTVPSGQVVGLLGANGSGKSTILRALCGLVPAQADRLLVAGEALPLGDGALLAQVGVVHQASSLDGKLTARENLQLAAKLYRVPRQAMPAAVAEALAQAALSDRADERVEQLSGGLRRRLELARAALHAPKALLLDEPTQGLDPLARAAFWQRLRSGGATHCLPTVLVATHDADEAALCDTVAFVHAGRITHSGPVGALLAGQLADVIELRGAAPEALAAGARALLAGADVSLAHDSGGTWVRIACQAGHTLVPPLIERLGARAVHSVSLRKASLKDVFAALTGRALDAEDFT